MDKKKIYVGYYDRIFVWFLLLILLLIFCVFFVSKSFNVNGVEVINYSEQGNIDYKVYLKDNDFYETKYLGKNMHYVASLIDKVDFDFNYQFLIDKISDINIGYNIYAKLQIMNPSKNSVYFEKTYNLLNKESVKIRDKKNSYLSEKISIDYDYYNKVANDFRSIYGVDAVSNLIVYMEFDKDVTSGNEKLLSGSNQMSVIIPLSQKSLNITIDDTSINSSSSVVEQKKIVLTNGWFLAIAILLFIECITALVKLIRLLSALFVKKSAYDKYIAAILREYDRLIVETDNTDIFEGKHIIKIRKLQELLDARDNLKLPIMYHELVKHQKCYFYIKQNDTIYLLTLKATDIEKEKHLKI